MRDNDASSKGEQRIAELAKLSRLNYAQCSKREAKGLGVTVATLDSIVKAERSKVTEQRDFLPHWKVEPRRASSLRHRHRRLRSARLAQEAEGAGGRLNKQSSKQIIRRAATRRPFCLLGHGPRLSPLNFLSQHCHKPAYIQRYTRFCCVLS
jgi:hypothetical protein